MRYEVNTNYLSIEAAAAICKALETHYGQPCMDRVVEAMKDDDYTVRLFDANAVNGEALFLANCVEDW